MEMSTYWGVGVPRAKRLDLALTLVLSVLAIALMADNKYGSDGPAHLSFLALPVFLIVTAALLWRSSDPLAGLGVAIVGLAVHWAAFGAVIRCGVAIPVIALLSFSAAARLDGRPALCGLGLGLLASLLLSATDWYGFGIVTAAIPVIAGSWLVGRLAHSRGRMTQALQARNEELKRARDERARLEVATDRAQLSAELDALLHRRLGELATLAQRGADGVGDVGGAGGAGDGNAVTLLADIERESRATLNEMRQLVGVLRSDTTGAELEPQPTLTSLEGLLMRSGVQHHQLQVDGSPRALPAGVELTAYRVVEYLLEGLGDSPEIRVGVRFMPDTLELTVEGPLRRRGQLVAVLARVRERVELHRGTLTTRTFDGRATTIAALPLSTPA
jgi:signal transduction histidine kinase